MPEMQVGIVGRAENEGEKMTIVLDHPNVKHGCARDDAMTLEYRSWVQMRSRCRNPKHHAWALYGGRGITVCERWDDFATFLTDMGPRPSTKHSLDRIDVNGNYEPGNCRWATATEQGNNRRDNRYLTHNGQIKTIALWADELGLCVQMIHGRLKRGWSESDALSVQSNERKMRFVSCNGKRQSIAAWSRESGVPRHTIYTRLNRGWTIEESLGFCERTEGNNRK